MPSKSVRDTLAERKKPRRGKPDIHHFNYRIVRWHSHTSDEVCWSLREVYYDKDDNVVGYGNEPVPLVAESYDGVKDELFLFLEAVVRPVLDGNLRTWFDPRDEA